MKKRYGAALVTAAAALLLTGCFAPVPAEAIPGVYRDAETGGVVRLEEDGTFTADDVMQDGHSNPADFGGSWDYDPERNSDFVYLTVSDGGLGKIGGVQLYVEEEGEVYFMDDPEEGPSLYLTKQD
ncbi:hypothetical protein ACIBI4_10035 [Streptomyces sp. NPDC050418]|uniref:hypothetical protein n=1 Tax=Streptomyces sp. NPDC050418 TaxID=3365612 RepID=UPI003789AF68